MFQKLFFPVIYLTNYLLWGIFKNRFKSVAFWGLFEGFLPQQLTFKSAFLCNPNFLFWTFMVKIQNLLFGKQTTFFLETRNMLQIFLIGVFYFIFFVMWPLCYKKRHITKMLSLFSSFDVKTHMYFLLYYVISLKLCKRILIQSGKCYFF